MKTILVTGSNGALGQTVVKLAKQYSCYNIIATSRDCNDINCKLDITNTGQLNSIISRTKPDIILHLAATLSNDFDEAYAINVEATRQLLKAVEHSGLGTRIALIGSAAEYGAIKPDDNPVREDHALNPVSIYGLTKAWQTQLAMLYSVNGLDVIVARVFNLDGPNLPEKLFVGRLQKQIEKVLSGQSSVIELGPLTASRDYISTDSAAEQILYIAEHGITGNVYHVASGKPVKMREILHRYLTKYNLDISIVHESTELTNRIGYDVPIIYADISRTLQLIQKKAININA